MPWTPHDLPFITDRAARAYRHLAEHWEQQSILDAPRIAAACIDSAAMLEMSSLTWLDADMCEMLSGMWRGVPDWTPEACIPGPQGIMALESPIFTAGYVSGDQVFDVPVRAIGWRVDGLQVRITAWSWSMDIPAQARSALRSGIDLEELFATTVPMSEVIDGANRFALASDAYLNTSIEQAGKALISVAGSAWLVMSQPKMVTNTPIAMRVKKRQPQGATVKKSVRVSVRSLTAPPRRAVQSTGRKATSRWWVRGHWRQQPWGKNRALRKPVFIAPHTAGNPDAPIDTTPKVQVWRTGDTNER